MRYALNLSEDSRILSVTYQNFAVAGQPIVDILPDGDVSDYLYVGGEYVYRPRPRPKMDIRASSNYKAGTMFMEAGELYRATQNIAANERILPRSNCESITIADALNEIKAQRN